MKFFFIILFSLFINLKSFAAEEMIGMPKHKWSFNGLTGKFDKSSLQRGYKVYREVCAACHGIRHISYRDLKGIGYTKDEIKIIASEYEVIDGPDDELIFAILLFGNVKIELPKSSCLLELLTVLDLE